LDELGFTWGMDDRRKKRSLSSTPSEENKLADDFEEEDFLEISTNMQTEESEELTEEEIEELYGDDYGYMFANPETREQAAAAANHYLDSRNLSPDAYIRELSHFEGCMTPHALGQALSPSIEEEDILEMKTMGYRYPEFAPYSWNHVVEALLVYKSIFGDLNVPEHFLLHRDIIRKYPKFPEKLEGMPLGFFVKSIRIGDVDGYEDKDRRELLDAMGFQWGDMSKYLYFPFQTMFQALRIYNHLYSFPMPQEYFVVPDEPQWPSWMVGIPLGEWAAVCRIQQKMLAKEYPNRKDLLDALEFIWWIPPSDKILQKYEHILPPEI
jgi:hypothetical protein